MSIKFRLTAMQFLQFFVWGAWLISLGGYMGGTLHFEGGQIGAIFATMGIASLIMPGLTGIIAMLLGAALQITNTYGDLFLGSFASIPEYADSFGVKHSVILLSISQMSETLFILAIPFFLKHFGIKRVMLISMFAWVFRFGLFALGDPGSGLWMLILSMIVYGMAFDFFNVSGSLFTEMEAHPSIRASAQGLFFMMTNGVGAIIGGYASGAVVDAFSVYAEGGGLVSRDWTPVWRLFSGLMPVPAMPSPWHCA